MSVAELHKGEVDRGERFAFGENWSRFLKDLTVARIFLAEQSLKNSLQLDRLDGLTFLDIGSGSGLFSLCARRLGAKVYSFDFDTHSVACTRELKRRYFTDDPDWTVEQGSVLDKDFLATLGTFDIVYSWGVLHHTGAMYEALQNVAPLVPVGGLLFIAIYNDQGAPTDEWERIKRRYNRLPKPLALAFALRIIARDEATSWQHHKHKGGLKTYLTTWTEYDKSSTRGMSKWHDWIDWIGGYPYERATVEQIVDFYAPDGFALQLLIDRSSGYGCNEFIFRRIAAAGTYVDSRLTGGNSMARRLGNRVVEPFSSEPDGIYGSVNLSECDSSTPLILIQNNRIVGEARLDKDSRVRLSANGASLDTVKDERIYAVPADSRTLPRPYTFARGKMWQADVSDLVHIADDANDPRRSTAFLFEDGVQLPLPHATHDEIDRYGAGRFSHWGSSVYFSSLDGDDPNTNGKEYRLLTAPQPLPADRSFAATFGVRQTGPFVLEGTGWTVAVPTDLAGHPLLLLKDDQLVSYYEEAPEKVVVAAATEPREAVESQPVFLVRGRLVDLSESTFGHQRGLLWTATRKEVEGLGDDVTGGRSPVFLFEDGRQLPYPHRSHDSIATAGGGAFSVWGGGIWFSTSDGSDPNDNQRTYTLLIPSVSPDLQQQTEASGTDEPARAAAESSYARRFGVRPAGGLKLEQNGWVVPVPAGLKGRSLLVIRDEQLIAQVATAGDFVVVAETTVTGEAVQRADIFLIAGSAIDLTGTQCGHQRGLLWLAGRKELEGLGDDVMKNDSPVCLFEDGHPLAHPHCSHDDIAQLGGGRYSCWDGGIWFSTSDGSDPNTNGRTYALTVPERSTKS